MNNVFGGQVNNLALGDGVAIAVLDTWPTTPTLPRQPQPATVAPFSTFATFQDLVDRAWDHHTACAPLDCSGKTEPTYQLVDHGMFVAGIVNDFAPAAPLGAFRVLSDPGPGSMTWVAEAINRAVAWYPTTGAQKLVLNLSFGFAPPLPLLNILLDDFPRIWTDDDYWGQRVQTVLRALPSKPGGNPEDSPSSLQLPQLQADYVVSTDGEYRFQDSLAILDFLFDFRNEPDVLLVAATGNDSCPKSPPFGPRIPAAMMGALAVSAFMPPAFGGGDWGRTSYSNDDDLLPNNDGVGGFGGLVSGAGASASTPGAAPVGLFRSSAVGQPVGFAYWSGTSFATPAIAGFAAALWSAAQYLAASDIRAFIVGGPGIPRATSGGEYLDFRQS